MGPDGPSNLTALLSRLIRSVERLEKRHRTDGEMLENLRWLLYVVERAMQKQGIPTSARRRPRVGKTLQGPAPTVQDVQYAGVGMGRVTVTFDQGEQVTLSRSLKELLVILAADVGESPDDLVAWKSFDRLGELLEKRLDRKFNHHTVSQLLCRLRKSFEAGSRGRGLIESSPELGARLRLKRRPLPTRPL